MSAAGKYGMRLFPDLVRVAAGIHFGSGPFPAPMHAFFYSRYGLVRSLCWLSDTAVHGQGIPDDLLHNYKR